MAKKQSAKGKGWRYGDSSFVIGIAVARRRTHTGERGSGAIPARIEVKSDNPRTVAPLPDLWLAIRRSGESGLLALALQQPSPIPTVYERERDARNFKDGLIVRPFLDRQ